MNDEIFRKKSLDRIKSPDSLDDYIRVSNPGVWLLLISVIVLLAGAVVWGIYGHIDSTVPTDVHVENGKAVCYVAEENISGISEGMTVKLDGREAFIEKIGAKEDAGYICTLSTDISLPDGSYDGEIVTESHTPISFVLN